MSKKIAIGVSIALLLVMLSASQPKAKKTKKCSMDGKLGNPLASMRLRMDSAGSGRYGASRGNRTHRGIDFIANKNVNVFAPCDGVILRKLNVYSDYRSWLKGLELKCDNGLYIKMFYCLVDESLIGKRVVCGQKIAIMQDVSEAYPNQGMLSHLHVEIRRNNTELLNPEPFFNFIA